MLKINLSISSFIAVIILFSPLASYSQNPDHLTVIKPKETDDVLINPGIGFMTFQRFNGDDLNEGSGFVIKLLS